MPKMVLVSRRVWLNGAFSPAALFVEDGRITRIEMGVGDSVSISALPNGFVCRDFDDMAVFPGFADVHVHFRVPGFSYKETIRTGSMAAARGGYTAVCTMPNLHPVPDNLAHLRAQTEIIDRDAAVRVVPFGALTVGEKGEVPSDIEGLAPYVAGFSDDGRGVQDRGMMRELMQRCKAVGKVISAHCEVNDLLHGGVIHDGDWARMHGFPGISSESEWRMIERDLALAAQTGCAYHVCHISTKESVSLIRDAKKSGVDVTAETAPHYLTLTDADLRDEGRFKMNPPIRGAADREALIAGVCDGTIDMIATDHAPHSAEEKARGLRGSLMGVVGLETAFPVVYTKLCRTGIVPLSRIIGMLTTAPLKRFELGTGAIQVGERADITVWDFDRVYTVEPNRFATMGRATPFAGWPVTGKCVATVADGKMVWDESEGE